MPQANDANLVRVYTLKFNGLIEELDPDIDSSTAGAVHKFDVIVEGESGDVREDNGSPYTLTLTAFDWTAGQSAATSVGAAMNPATLATPLNQSFHKNTTNLPPLGSPNPLPAGVTEAKTAWPAYAQKFHIELTDAEATNAAGHVFQYTAVLQATGSDPIDSIAQSPLFILV